MSKLDHIDRREGRIAPDDAAMRIVVPSHDWPPNPPPREETQEVREVPPTTPAARAPDAGQAEEHAVDSADQNRRRKLRMLLMIGGILAVVLAGGITWLRSGRYVSTDDAYVHAAKLMVSTDVSGLVSSVEVHEGQTVKAGDILFRIDPKQFQIALDNAKANLAQTALTVEAMKQDYKRMLSDVAAQKAQVELDQAQYDRYVTLMRTDTVSKANYDQARFTLEADKSKLASLQQQAQVQLARLDGNPEIPATQHPQYLQVKAQVDEAQRQLDHTVVRAPFDGVATQVDSLQPGTYLVSQTAALTNTGAIGLVVDGQRLGRRQHQGNRPHQRQAG